MADGLRTTELNVRVACDNHFVRLNDNHDEVRVTDMQKNAASHDAIVVEELS